MLASKGCGGGLKLKIALEFAALIKNIPVPHISSASTRPTVQDLGLVWGLRIGHLGFVEMGFGLGIRVIGKTLGPVGNELQKPCILHAKRIGCRNLTWQEYIQGSEIMQDSTCPVRHCQEQTTTLLCKGTISLEHTPNWVAEALITLRHLRRKAGEDSCGIGVWMCGLEGVENLCSCVFEVK